MTTWICGACGTQYPPSDVPPAACPICEDARQYVPHDRGQQWVAWDDFISDHTAVVRQDNEVLGIGCEPEFAIGQRALLVESDAGNILWECTTYLDDELVARVRDEGGLAAIAISHPHYYSAMVEWAHAFDCPIYIHQAERKWVMRPDDSIRFSSGETNDLGGGLTLVRCGGHFEGAQVLHQRDDGALFTGDIVMVIPDRRYVSFMFSYPNLIPLPPSKVRAIAGALDPFEFERIYGAWWGRVIGSGGSEIVRRSADRYVQAVTEPGLPS
jgi:glyoxylase-like metal-dependent hydrolase (beta-lactamase superfamily II)